MPIDSPNPGLIQSWLRFLILSALANEPMLHSTLELRIEQQTRRFFESSRDSFWKALEQLLSEGSVKSGWRETDHLKRELVYSLTAAGKERLEAECKDRHSALAQFVEEGKWQAFNPHKAQPDNWN